VTGGAGFIGSCVIKELNDKGLSNIVVVDSLKETEKWKNLVGKQFYDILEKEQLFSWLEGRESEIEAFIHLGACSSTVERNASYLLENNYRYTLKLAEYALKNNQRFIYASSAATYGDGALGFSDDHELLPKLYPLNMYGYSKHLFDLWALNQGVLNQVTGLKYFNVFGPNEAHKGRMASAVVHLLPKVLSGNPVQLFESSEPEKYANGGQMRDFIYGKDVAKMTCAFLQNDATGIYNIGTGKPETWNALAEALFAAVDKPAKIEYIKMPGDLVGKYQNYTCADVKKTKNALKQEFVTTPFPEAVSDYVKNYLIPGALW
jgi:ADP-L-glycero-D-manno-heptose 6-epimerase